MGKYSSIEKRHRSILFISFFFLGGHVGVWSTLMPNIVINNHINGVQLGLGLSLMSFIGLFGLFFGGFIGDKLGRKPLLLLGLCGTGAFFASIQFINSYITLLIIFCIGGFLISFYDLFVNTVGTDYESLYNKHILPALHATFSLGAASCAFVSGLINILGLNYLTVYTLFGIILFGIGVVLSFFKLPKYRGEKTEHDEEKNTVGDGKKTSISLIRYLIVFSCLTICFCFIIDGSLEGFLALYLTELFPHISTISSFGITALFTAAFIGRLTSSKLINKFGETNLLIIGSFLAFFGLLIVALNSNPIISAIAVFITGLGVSPIVPIGYSIAGRVASIHGAKVMSLITGFGYVSLIIGPIIVGSIGNQFSLSLSFLFLSFSALVIFLLSVISRKNVKKINIRKAS